MLLKTNPRPRRLLKEMVGCVLAQKQVAKCSPVGRLAAEMRKGSAGPMPFNKDLLSADHALFCWDTGTAIGEALALGYPATGS